MSIFRFSHSPSVVSSAAVVGGLEHQGPLGDTFDLFDHDTKFGMDSWEKAESRMIEECTAVCLKKRGISADQIDFAFAGDLMNQCTASSFAFRGTKIPYFGLYGACSTFVMALGLSAMCVDSGYGKNALALASSHFCTAERQYRFPLEYSNQRTPTSQTTVTGCGCVIVSGDKDSEIEISEFMPGRILDLKIKDTNNMGAAMAPAALDTLFSYLNETGSDPENFDLIATGDLGAEGKKMLKILASQKGIELGKNYEDCGVMIYDPVRQDVHAGGSGCGCSASVFSAHLISLFKKKKINDMLLVGTGALMSPTTALQKESIPGIAHLVRVRRK